MGNFKKLVSFDFDSTLVHTMGPEVGKPQWEKTTGLSWPGKGWWGSAESLNTEVFYHPLNQWVYKRFEQYQSNDENYVFIATGRLKKLENHVKKILDIHEVSCDLYTNTGGETFRFKCRLFETLIRNNPMADELIMFDDRHEHLGEFVKWGKRQPIKITIWDVVNKVQLL